MQSVLVFIALSTQWRRAGMSGVATGLDYNAMYRKLDRLNLTPEQYDWAENDLRILEDAALEKMREDEKNRK